MAADELNAFLNGAAAPEPAAAEPEPQAAPVESTPEAEPKAGAAAKPDAKATPEPDDAADTPEPTEDGKIAFQAFERERARRQDWKEKAVRAETQRDDLQRQLDEAKRAASQPQQPPPAPPQPIDPSQDPQGFVNRIQGVVLNERLNTSEMMMREKHGAEKVDAVIAQFKQFAQQDPSMFQKLYAQPHPYDFAFKEVERRQMQSEIGDDPAAYRERIRQEAIAEFQKTNGNGAPRVSPAAGMAPSLATARSVAGRSAPAWTGPESLDDLVARIHRKN